jgi:polyadenylate-binding protein
MCLARMARLTAEKALATVHGRPIPDMPSVTLNLSPFPATSPPTPLPPPAAQPRLVKHLAPGCNDAMIYDIFRPYGALANVRTGIIGPDSALVEFWREEDARAASEALHCADIGGSNIAIQLYQPRRAPASGAPELHATAPSFVPSGNMFAQPHSNGHHGPGGTNVCTLCPASVLPLSDVAAPILAQSTSRKSVRA